MTGIGGKLEDVRATHPYREVETPLSRADPSLEDLLRREPKIFDLSHPAILDPLLGLGLGPGLDLDLVLVLVLDLDLDLALVRGCNFVPSPD